jgi:hypothetical protein
MAGVARGTYLALFLETAKSNRGAKMKFVSGLLFGVVLGLIMAVTGAALGAVIMPVRALLRRI